MVKTYFKTLNHQHLETKTKAFQLNTYTFLLLLLRPIQRNFERDFFVPCKDKSKKQFLVHENVAKLKGCLQKNVSQNFRAHLFFKYENGALYWQVVILVQLLPITKFPVFIV